MLYEDEESVKATIDFISYRTHGNPWINDTDKYDVLDNYILTLRSIYQVSQLWKKNQKEYDFIIYLRADVLYLNPLKKEYFNSTNNTIVLPEFAEYPINDRFAIGNPKTMIIYGERYNDAYEYSLNNLMHSETYLDYILKKNNINIIKIPFYFSRIGIDGKNRDEELEDK